MDKYSSQMIADLCNKIDPEIVEFWNTRKEELELHDTLYDCVDSVFEDFFQGKTGKEDLKEIQKAVAKVCDQKKRRLQKKAHTDNEKYEISNKKNPFHRIYEEKEFLSNAQWNQLYGGKSLSEVVMEKAEQVDTWKSEKAYIIQCPIFDTLRKSGQKDAFYQDLFMNIADIINRDYAGNIRLFFVSSPDFLSEVPAFSTEGKRKILTEMTEQGVYEYLVSNTEGNYQVRYIAQNEDGTLKTFDERDRQILNFIVSNVKENFTQSKSVRFNIGDVARYLYGSSRISDQHVRDIEIRLKNMISLQFEYRMDGIEKVYNLFQSYIAVKEDLEGKKKGANVEIVFSDMLFEAVEQKALIQVKTKEYNELEMPLSKNMFYILQKERILLTKEQPYHMSKEYDYLFFARRIAFQKGQKKNISLLKTSLEEFKSKGIVVEDYKVVKDKFYITYVPLSENERADWIGIEEG